MEGLEQIKPDEYSPEERARDFERESHAPEAPEGMPGVEASSEELAEYLLTQLSLSYDPREPGAPPFEEYSQTREMHVYLAEELLPKVNNERVREQLRGAIEQAKQVH